LSISILYLSPTNIKKKTESFVKKFQKTEGWLGFSDLFGTSQPINVENRKTNLLDFLILITPIYTRFEKPSPTFQRKMQPDAIPIRHLINHSRDVQVKP